MKLSEYKELVCKTSEIYHFKKINKKINVQKIKDGKEKICFLRHDIDFSPENAEKIAKVEAENNVVSTFTILLSGQYYNPLEKKTKNLLREIKKYGHEIGLHFDPTVYDIKTEKELDKFIRKEAKIIEDLVEGKVNMFSFHNTTEFSMSCRSDQYGGLINAYSDFFQNDVQYTSDSNGYWRFRSWEDLLSEDHKIIQILTHPIWWKENNYLPPFETIINNTLDRYIAEISDYTNMFDGQQVRINKSQLSSVLTSILNQNDATILNKYSTHPPLIRFLLNDKNAVSISDLDNIAKNFIKR